MSTRARPAEAAAATPPSIAAGARILLLGQTFTAPQPEQRMTEETAIDLEADEMEFLDKAKLSLVSSTDTIAASR